MEHRASFIGRPAWSDLSAALPSHPHSALGPTLSLSHSASIREACHGPALESPGVGAGAGPESVPFSWVPLRTPKLRAWGPHWQQNSACPPGTRDPGEGDKPMITDSGSCRCVNRNTKNWHLKTTKVGKKDIKMKSPS